MHARATAQHLHDLGCIAGNLYSQLFSFEISSSGRGRIYMSYLRHISKERNIYILLINDTGFLNYNLSFLSQP